MSSKLIRLILARRALAYRWLTHLCRIEVPGHKEVHMIYEPIQKQGRIKLLPRKGPGIEKISPTGLNRYYIELMVDAAPKKEKRKSNAFKHARIIILSEGIQKVFLFEYGKIIMCHVIRYVVNIWLTSTISTDSIRVRRHFHHYQLLSLIKSRDS